MTENTRYASVRQLAERYQVSPSTIWRWVANGTLPKPIRLSTCCTRWKIDEVKARDAEREAAAA